MAPKGKATKARAAKAPTKAASHKAPPPRRPHDSPGLQSDVRAILGDLALLAAANNLMAQTAFLSLERMRITSEVVDEAVTDDFAAQLYDRCEKLVRASDDVILRLLDEAGAADDRADLVRGLIQMRREFATRARPPVTQTRLLESLERMYR